MENSAERRTEWLEWKSLIAYQEQTATRSLLEWFDREPERVDRMQIESAGLFLDYSKNRIDLEGMDRLLALAERAGLPNQIDDLMSGKDVNRSEEADMNTMANAICSPHLERSIRVLKL